MQNANSLHVHMKKLHVTCNTHLTCVPHIKNLDKVGIFSLSYAVILSFIVPVLFIDPYFSFKFINFNFFSYSMQLCTMLGSAIQKINFYKSIPLPLWDVRGSIPLLDLPWNWRHDCCLHRNVNFRTTWDAKFILKFPAPCKGLDDTCHLARSYLELLYLKSTHSNKQMMC